MTDYRRFAPLAVAALVWFLGKFLRYAFPPLFGTLGDAYGVSRTVLGTAFTGFMLVYAAMQLPSGLLADRIGSVRVIVGGAVVSGLGAMALVVDAPVGVLAGGMVLMGAGTGTFKTVSIRFLSRVYPSRTGRVLGVFDMIGTFGGVAAPAAVVAVTAGPVVFGAPWRTLFLGGGLAMLGLAAVTGTRIREPDDSNGDTGEGGESDGVNEAESTGSEGEGSDAKHASGREPSADPTHLDVLREPAFLTFVGVTVLFAFAYNGAVAFLPLYLSLETPLSAATANLLFSALFLASVAQPVTGEASDRMGNLPVMAAAQGLATAGIVAVLVLAGAGTGGTLAFGVAVVALGLGAHGFRPVRGAYLMDVIPEGVAGGSLGVVRSVLMGAGAVAPAIVGALSETAGFGPAFGLLAASLGGATGLTVLLWATERRE